MPAFTMTKNWDDGTILTESQLDDIKNSTEDFLNTTKLDNGNIQNGGLATANYADTSITTQKIADLNVTTAKINDAAVTTAKIADTNVTTGKLADNAVTLPKLVALGQTVSSSTGTTGFAATGSFSAVTNLSATITVSAAARPVFVGLIGDGGSNAAIIGSYPSNVMTHGQIRFKRASSVIELWQIDFQGDAANPTHIGTPSLPCSSFWTIDTGATAGSQTYTVEAVKTDGVLAFKNIRLIAFEL